MCATFAASKNSFFVMEFAPKRFFTPTLYGFLALLSWSCSGVLTWSILEKIPLLYLMAIGYAISGTIIVFTYQQRLKSWRPYFGNSPFRLISLALLFSTMSMAYCGAIALIDNSEQLPALLAINYFWPTLAVLIAIPILSLKIQPYILFFGVILGTAGLLLVVFSQLAPSKVLPPTAAILLMLLSNLAWALFSALSRRFHESLGNGAHIGLHHLFVSFVAFILILLTKPSEHSLDYNTVGLVLIYALWVLAFGYWGWDYGMRKGRFEILSSISYLIPVVSIGLAALILSATVPPIVWIGLALFISASYFCRKAICKTLITNPSPPISTLALPGAKGKR